MGSRLTQNHTERLLDRVQRGELTADQFNVEKVKIARVHLVTSKIPAQARKALNEAVKRGELGHIKKDGHKPEAYFHPTFEYLVSGERSAHERSVLAAKHGILV